jgi:hypothetical protein
VGLAVAWVGILAPWLDAAAERADRLASQRELLRAERDLLASDEAFRDAARTAARRLRAASRQLLSGPSEGAAAASLEQLVRDRAMAHRVLVTSTSPRPPEAVGDALLAVGLEVQGESDLRGIAGLLTSLVEEATLVRVSGLRIRRASGAGGDPAALGFRAAITGFLLATGDTTGEVSMAASARSRPTSRPDARPAAGEALATAREGEP